MKQIDGENEIKELRSRKLNWPAPRDGLKHK